MSPFWLVLPLLPFLYVASVGPVLKCLDPSGPYVPYFMKIYAPLGWAYEHSAWARAALDMYLQLWRV